MITPGIRPAIAEEYRNTYDPLGRLIIQTDAANPRTDSYFAGTQDIETRSGVSAEANGTASALTYYSPVYVNAAMARDRDGDLDGTADERVYFTHDANYNVTGVISTAGTASQYQIYDAYGKVTFADDTWTPTTNNADGYALEHLYQGMLYNAAVGWYFAGQSNEGRWYSPEEMIWTKGDVGYIDGMNLYAFCAANPINRVDPTGTTSLSVDINGPVWLDTASLNGPNNYRDVNGKPITDVGAYFFISEVETMDNSWSDWWNYSGWGSMDGMAHWAKPGDPVAFRQFYVPVKMKLTETECSTENFANFRKQNPEIADELIRYALASVITAKAMKAIQDNAKVTYNGLLFSALAPALGIAAAKAFDAIRNGATNPLAGLSRVGHALKTDPYHAFPDMIDNFAVGATRTQLKSGATLLQVEGSLNGVAGRFEWIIDGGAVTHRLFVGGGSMNGIPIVP